MVRVSLSLARHLHGQSCLLDYTYFGPLSTLRERSALDRRAAQVLRALSQATWELASYYSSLKFKPSSTNKSPRRTVYIIFCNP